MAEDSSKRAADRLAATADWPELVRKIRARTPARILVGRAGPAYRTETQLQLREDHAVARDAVRAELDVNAAFGAEFVARWKLFEVRTRATSKDEYLQHPSLGRAFDDASRSEIVRRCAADRYRRWAIGSGDWSAGAATAAAFGGRRWGARLERGPDFYHSSLPRGDCERDWRAAEAAGGAAADWRAAGPRHRG